jgi:SpoVK/Ycf46/Vps4 family AAA+-type ATPase
MNNAMQNILLQYLEDFEGIFIATTNLPASLDEAFNRRFLYKVEFKNPDKEIRMQMLQHHFPQLPQPYLKQLNDRYPLTGAQLMNINKKILVEQLLRPEADLLEMLEQFCAEERPTLSKHKAQPIGFMKRA